MTSRDVDLRLNPNLERDAAAEVKPSLVAAAAAAAAAATEVGKTVADSYEATVHTEGDDVYVVARTSGISAPGWIEYGTAKLPAAAPLRRGAERAGLDYEAR